MNDGSFPAKRCLKLLNNGNNDESPKTHAAICIGKPAIQPFAQKFYDIYDFC